MLSVLAMLLMHGSFFTLRMNTATGSFPRPLKAEEERELLRRSGEGDLAARNKLIEHNLRLVAHIVKKYYTQSGDADDLISIGTIGLIKAVNTYRADKKIKLATYAARCIENEILMYLRKTRKLAGEVSLSETLETDGDGGNLSILDLIRADDDMLEELDTRDACVKVAPAWRGCWTSGSGRSSSPGTDWTEKSRAPSGRWRRSAAFLAPISRGSRKRR